MTEQKCVNVTVMDLFLACCSFIFNKLISEMNVKVIDVLNMTMKI